MDPLSERSPIVRTRWRLAAVVAALALVGTGAAMGGGSAATADSATSLGAYAGYQAVGGVHAFGRAVGQQPTFGTEFLDGDSWNALVSTAPSYMAAWKKSGLDMVWAVPMLPYDSSRSSPKATAPGTTLRQGASGAYNQYFLKLAQEMVAGGQADSIIRIGWEFNGSWFPWSAAGQASTFIAYWRQIVDTMRSVPGQEFRFAWNPNLGSTEGVGDLADYYPGDTYVDYIGLDVYDQAFGYYGSPGCAGATCQQEQFDTILTEPGGLNWLASFAKQEGKPVVLPEWGLGAFSATDLNGTYMDQEIGGGDDPSFIYNMIAWIDAHDVFEAGYWDYQQDATGAAPLSAAALRNALGGGSSTASGTTTGAGPSSGGGGATNTGTGSGSGSGGNFAFIPSLLPVLPIRGQVDSAVTIQGPTAPVISSTGAHFSAVVSTVPSTDVTPAGTVTWSITSASGAAVRCRSGTTAISRNSGMTACNVAPGVFSAADGPYAISVTYAGNADIAPSSATLMRRVATSG